MGIQFVPMKFDQSKRKSREQFPARGLEAISNY
jgi:hypothetical protein